MCHRRVVVIHIFFVDSAEMKGSNRLLWISFAHLNEEREKEPFV